MKPIDFPQASKTLGSPADILDGSCDPLIVFSDGKQCVSKWKPTFWERIKILFGQNIYLGVRSGGTQPPVWMAAEEVFQKPPFFSRVRDFGRKVINYITEVEKSVWEAAKQPDKRKHFIVGFIIAVLVGFLTDWIVGWFVGSMAGAMKEWWDSKGHGTVELMDFVFTSMGSFFAVVVTWWFNLENITRHFNLMAWQNLM